MLRIPVLLIGTLAVVLAVPQAGTAATIPAGTSVSVRTNSTIDAKNASSGQVFSGVVAAPIMDKSGRVVIPQGSAAELVVRNASKHEIAVSLAAINIGGKRFAVASDADTISGSKKAGVGKNKRTAEHVGGGAAAGTIIGAIAGGGKGALIGGLLGGGAGAGIQTLTRGKSVHVPAETVLTFRLDRPLTR